MMDVLPRNEDGTLTDEVRTKLLDKKDASIQFMHMFNLFAIFGQDGIDKITDQYLEAGWSMEHLKNAMNEGMNKSNWMKNSFVNERIESQGKRPIKISYK
jgi:hypothetical protein